MGRLFPGPPKPHALEAVGFPQLPHHLGIKSLSLPSPSPAGVTYS